MKKNDIMRRAVQVITPALHLYYPIVITNGSGIHVVSTDGRRYMDFSSGLAVLNIGHNHPHVLAAVRKQLDAYIHTGGVYYNETTVAAAERLTKATPKGMDMLFLAIPGQKRWRGH